MTTTTAKVTGVIHDRSIKQNKNGDDYLILEVMQSPSDQYAVKVYDHEMKGDHLSKGTSVAFEVEEQDGTFQGKAIKYRNLVSILDEEPDFDPSGAPKDIGPDEEPARLTAPRERPAAPRDNREDGMAYGAAQHAVSRVFGAFIAKHGRSPDDAEVDWMLTYLKDMTDKAFRNRLPL